MQPCPVLEDMARAALALLAPGVAAGEGEWLERLAGRELRRTTSSACSASALVPPHRRDSPALTPSPPADAAPGGRACYEVWEILFGDGAWHVAQVRCWRKDAAGRDVADVEWHAGVDSWGGAYVADRGRMREPR